MRAPAPRLSFHEETQKTEATHAKVSFKRGTKARAKRDVLAKKLSKHKKIKTPYALATSMVKKGAKVKDTTAVKAEVKVQKMKPRGHILAKGTAETKAFMAKLRGMKKK